MAAITRTRITQSAEGYVRFAELPRRHSEVIRSTAADGNLRKSLIFDHPHQINQISTKLSPGT